jgi:hypothetical protein
MKTLITAVLAISVFVTVALAVDTRFKTRLITSSTLTIQVKDGQFITIRNFTQDQDVGQRGVIVAGVVASTPTPTPTATPTATPTLSTNAGPGVALSTGDKLNDTATILFGNNNANGMITFTLFDPTNLPVYNDVVTVNGNGTYDTTSMGNTPGGYLPTVIGTYTWTALYSNDTNGNPAVMDNHQNETVNVTATPTPIPTPTPAPTPTLIFGTVLTASLGNVSSAVSAEYIQPIIIAGQATLTIDPVPGATLSITYRKSLQPIQPTPTSTP